MFMFVVLVILNCLSFLLFFFTVPYWTGSEMRDVTKNGIYRLAYVGVSWLGYKFFQLVEWFTDIVTRWLKKKWLRDTLRGLLNLALYVGIIYFTGILYEQVCIAITGVEGAEVEFQDFNFKAFTTNVFSFNMMFTAFRQTHESAGLFQAIGLTALRILGYVIWTVFYFTFVYGILKQKVVEVRYLEKRKESSWLGKYLEYEPEDSSLSSFYRQCLAGFAEFVNKFSIFRNFYSRRICIIFLVLTSILCWRSYDPDDVYSTLSALWQLAIDVADESNLIVIVQSFILSFITGKVLVVLGKLIYKKLPESVQEKIDASSAKANEVVKSIEERREEWAERKRNDMENGPSRTIVEFIRPR